MYSMVAAIIVLLATLFVWHKLWKDYALEKLRDDLFSIRNDLFDLVDENKGLSFDDKLYLTFENILNNSIRSGYKLSYAGAIIFSTLLKIFYPGKVVTSRIQRAYVNMDHDIKNDELKEKINQLKKQFEISIIKYLLKTSITFLTISTIKVAGIIISELFNRAKKVTVSYIKDQTREKLGELINDIEYQAEALA